jgi:hypothetical protein
MVDEATLGSLTVRAVGLALNAPIDARLDQLWAIARGAGQPTTRQEIVAALILEADPRSKSLDKLLNRYRATPIGNVPVPGAASMATLAPKRPGRRRFLAEDGRASEVKRE